MMMRREELMLVLLAQQGDRDALNSLLQRVEARLFRYLCGILSNDASNAEDVLQETLLRIARKLGWLTEPQAFEAWIYRIASNEAYRALKRLRRRLAEEQLPEALLALEPIAPKLEPGELRARIGDLSPASRAAVVLHYQEERPLDVLTRMERAERNYKLAFVVVAAVEGLFLVAFLFLADFSNRTHVLLLLGTVMTYSIVGAGLVALGAHVNRAILRVLQAIDGLKGV